MNKDRMAMELTHDMSEEWYDGVEIMVNKEKDRKGKD